MKNNYWFRKTVLVTGAHGFVGKSLVAELHKIGVTPLAPPRQRLDLTSQDEVRDYFLSTEPDVVIHLAGMVGGIGINKKKPAEFFYDNLMMGALVTHWAHECGAEKLVSLAAGCGYPSGLKAPFKEENFWMGFPDMNSYGYSMAKKNLIIQSLAYREQHGFNSTVLLPANLYGPHDNFDLETSHVVPALIRKFMTAREEGLPSVTVWGTGAASREFLYVGDVAKAIIDVVVGYDETGPLNLGTGVETTVIELAEIIKLLTGYQGDIIWDSSRPDGQARRYYDMNNFKEAMGYVPSTTLVDGLKQTIKWYKNNR